MYMAYDLILAETTCLFTQLDHMLDESEACMVAQQSSVGVHKIVPMHGLGCAVCRWNLCSC